MFLGLLELVTVVFDIICGSHKAGQKTGMQNQNQNKNVLKSLF